MRTAGLPGLPGRARQRWTRSRWLTAVRIQKVLADAGVASRRAADALVAAGRVTVNGTPAVIGQRVDPERGPHRRGRPSRCGAGRTSHLAGAAQAAGRHEHRRRPPRRADRPGPASAGAARIRRRLYPVGRLDQDSEGLLLLTNDGDWAQRVLHPSYEVEREYAIGLRAAPRPRRRSGRLAAGIELDEGLATLAGLRLATRTRVGTAGERRRERSRADLVPGGADPGLAASAAAHVRGRGRPRGAPRPGAHRDPAPRRPPDAASCGRSPRRSATGWSRMRRRRTSSRSRPPGVRPRPAAGRRLLDGPGPAASSSVGAAAARGLWATASATPACSIAASPGSRRGGRRPTDRAALVGLVPRDAARAGRGGPPGAGARGRPRRHRRAARRRRSTGCVSAVAADPASGPALLPVQRELAAAAAS